ncbi:hypothetical protein [Haloarcula limicola]|nr:hypothetical protein [Halomicroarcula limicola]
MSRTLDRFDHPAWVTAAGMFAGYGLVLAFLFLSLFVIPFLLFTM